MSRRRLRVVLPLLGLATALIAIDLIVWGGSALRLFLPRRDPMLRDLRGWFVELETSPAFRWKVAKSVLVAGLLAAVAFRRRQWWPLAWSLLFANVALAMSSRYHDRLGSAFADATGISTDERWGLLVLALITGALVLLGLATAPRSWSTVQLFVIVVALLGLATVLDVAGDGADTRRSELAVIHLEAAAELGMLTIALVHSVHLLRGGGHEPESEAAAA